MPAARHTSPTQGLSLSPILAAFHRIPRNLANRKKRRRNRVGRSVAGVSKGKSVRNMAAEALGTPAARLSSRVVVFRSRESAACVACCVSSSCVSLTPLSC